jgi:hypothetical protein
MQARQAPERLQSSSSIQRRPRVVLLQDPPSRVPVASIASGSEVAAPSPEYFLQLEEKAGDDLLSNFPLGCIEDAPNGCSPRASSTL